MNKLNLFAFTIITLSFLCLERTYATDLTRCQKSLNRMDLKLILEPNAVVNFKHHDQNLISELRSLLTKKQIQVQLQDYQLIELFQSKNWEDLESFEKYFTKIRNLEVSLNELNLRGIHGFEELELWIPLIETHDANLSKTEIKIINTLNETLKFQEPMSLEQRKALVKLTVFALENTIDPNLILKEFDHVQNLNLDYRFKPDVIADLAIMQLQHSEVTPQKFSAALRVLYNLTIYSTIHRGWADSMLILLSEYSIKLGHFPSREQLVTLAQEINSIANQFHWIQDSKDEMTLALIRMSWSLDTKSEEVASAYAEFRGSEPDSLLALYEFSHWVKSQLNNPK